MDGAFFGSLAYVLAHSRLGLEPLVRPVNPDGTSTYHGYLFVRKDSGILSTADMRGKRFAFVDRATTAGYVFPLAYLRQHGIVDPLSFLGESFFAGSHDAAVFAVLDGQADVGAAKNTIYDRLARENGRIRSELRIIGTWGVVPQNCLAVRKDLDEDLKTALSAALLGMDRDPEGSDALRQFGARGFMVTADGDYDYVYALAAQAGTDVQRLRTAARAAGQNEEENFRAGLVLLLLIFALGSVVVVIALHRTTAHMDRLLLLHQVELQRQSLIIHSFLRVRAPCIWAISETVRDSLRGTTR